VSRARDEDEFGESRYSRPWTVVPILGLPVDALSAGELEHEMGRVVEDGERALILHVNAHAMNLAARDPWFRGILERARIVFCDGAGVQVAAALLGHRIPERITYADWVSTLAPFAARRGWRLFFLGGRPGVAAEAAKRLEKEHGLVVAGVHHGYFDVKSDSQANRAVRRAIRVARADVLLVGLGMPLQERWLDENWGAVDVPIALTCGAAFDYWAGHLRRAPQWMIRHRLEWLGRLLIEPSRLWRRYLLGNPRFLVSVLRHRLRLLAGSGR
jgi:N-acetylglucosaminyldiphosphoundecaprenol N-acetyl-beta-D-mannosaminyltransferase